MNNGSDYDFIIIGSGAGGGTLAYRLAPAARRFCSSNEGHSSGARRRTLTIMANASRVGDHLLERMDASSTAEELKRELNAAPQVALA